MLTNSIQGRIEKLFPEIGNQIMNQFDLNRLELYFLFLRDFNEIGGFFSKSDSENILDRHVLESVIHIFKIINSIPVSHETQVADIGTGPGLPGYIFTTLKNPPNITLIDSQRKRLELLEQFHKKNFSHIGLNFIYGRAEDLHKKFDLVVMRSAIKYPWSAEVVCNLLKNNSYFIPFLGKKNYDSEFEAKLLDNLGYKIEKEISLNELEFLGNRHIKILKKTTESKKGFPRKWESLSKEIKRLSWEK